MKPIIFDLKHEFDPEEFEKYLLKLCDFYKKEGRALAFAFIVYDFEDHSISELLKNKSYWTALDKISGKYLTIFYIDSQNSYFLRRQREIYLEEKKFRKTDASSMGFVSSIVMKSTPLDNTIATLQEKFGIDEDVNHPFVLFFQTNGSDVIDSFVVTLKEDETDKSFYELKRQIQYAIETVSRLDKRDKNFHQEIFNLIRDDVERGNTGHLIKTRLQNNVGIGIVFSLIRLLAVGHPW